MSARTPPASSRGATRSHSARASTLSTSGGGGIDGLGLGSARLIGRRPRLPSTSFKYPDFGCGPFTIAIPLPSTSADGDSTFLTGGASKIFGRLPTERLADLRVIPQVAKTGLAAPRAAGKRARQAPASRPAP